MSAQTFDILVGLYAQTLNGAFAALTPIGLGLLVACAILELRLGLMWASVDGYWNLPRLIGIVCGILIQVGVVALLLTQMNAWTTEAMNRMLEWSGQATRLDSARQIIWTRPSTLIDTGFLLAAPLKSMMLTTNLVDMASYTAMYLSIVVFFCLIALAVMMTQISFQIAVIAGLILLPWIILKWTMFLGTGFIHWIAGTAVQLFVLGLTVAGVIIFVGLLPPTNSVAGLPPTLDDAITLTFLTFVCCAVAWFIPPQVGRRFGGGTMTVGQTLAGPLAIFGAASAVIGGVRTVSSLIPRR